MTRPPPNFASARAAGLIALAVGLVAFAADPPAESAADPVPIRRVLLPPNLLAAELAKPRSSPLVRLKLADFETRIRAAAKAPPAKTAPRLVEARYRAKLAGDVADEAALVGSAEWKIAHPTDATAVLPLDGLQLALRSAKWPDSKPAVLAPLDGPTPQPLGLLLDKDAGKERSLLLEWSARGLPEPGEVRFALPVPAVPVATLELDLPSGIAPSAPQSDVSLTGPFPGDGPGRSAWRVAFGGVAPLEIVLPRPGAASATPRAKVRSVVEVSAIQVVGRYEFQVEAPRRGEAELLFECDADLTPTDVTVNNLEGWKPVDGAAAGRRRLLVKLREPVRGAAVVVTAAAPPPPRDATWTVPAVRLLNGVPRGETVELRASPDVQLADVRPNGFRLLGSEFAADHTHVLRFQAGLAADGPADGPPRPKAKVRPVGPDFAAAVKHDLTVTPDAAVLAVRASVAVERGPLPRLQLRLPAGWDIEHVEADGDDAATWAAASSALTVEWSRPVPTGGKAAVALRLRQPLPAETAKFEIPLPEVAVPAAARKDGTLTIRVGPAFLAWSPAGDPAAAGPGESAWDYRFRGTGPDGRLLLDRRAARLRADVAAEVVAGPERLRSPGRDQTGAGRRGGALRGHRRPRRPGRVGLADGRDERRGEHRRLPVAEALLTARLLAASPVPAHAPWPAGDWWRVAFARPLDGPVALVGTCGQPGQSAVAAAAGGAVAAALPARVVPLPEVVGAERAAGACSAAPPPPGFAWDVGSLTGNDGGTPVPYRRPPALTLRPGTPRPAVAPVADGATLDVSVPADGPATVRYRVRLTGWRGGPFSLSLPDGADVVAAAAAGKRMPAGGWPSTRGRPRPRVVTPVPADGMVEVAYALPAADGWLAGGPACMPELRCRPRPPVRTWRFARGLVPPPGRGWAVPSRRGPGRHAAAAAGLRRRRPPARGRPRPARRAATEGCGDRRRRGGQAARRRRRSRDRRRRLGRAGRAAVRRRAAGHVGPGRRPVAGRRGDPAVGRRRGRGGGPVGVRRFRPVRRRPLLGVAAGRDARRPAGRHRLDGLDGRRRRRRSGADGPGGVQPAGRSPWCWRRWRGAAGSTASAGDWACLGAAALSAAGLALDAGGWREAFRGPLFVALLLAAAACVRRPPAADAKTVESAKRSRLAGRPRSACWPPRSRPRPRPPPWCISCPAPAGPSRAKSSPRRTCSTN